MSLLSTDALTVDVTPAGVAFFRIDVPGHAINVLNQQLLGDLEKAIEVLSRQAGLTLLVIQSGKRTGFIAGADVHELAQVSSAGQARRLSERGQRLMRSLADLGIPSLAVIHGACLGGGLELALACDYRLAVDVPATQLGLPEVELGLIPAWGGTQRLPRTIGLERALQLIVAGRRLDARRAQQQGLVDQLVAEPLDLAVTPHPLMEEAARNGKRKRDSLPLQNWRQRVLESTAVGRRLLFRAFERILRGRVPDDMRAPWEALDALRTGMTDGFDAGLHREQEAVTKLAEGNACKNLIGLFLRREEVRKSLGASEQPVMRVGVVGAGTMGAGIVELAALKGCDVSVQEVNEDALGAGVMRIAALFQKALQQGILSEEEFRRNLARVRPTIRWEGFDRAELVVEAASEDLAIKQALFKELESRTSAQATLATNTSSLLVGSLQERLAHPERVVGLHFFNPVHRMPLVEVVRGPRTAARAIEQAAQWAAGLGKTPLVVKDSPGFIVNRVLIPYLNEAVLLLLEGMETEKIDHVMVRFGMPLGPLELLDQIGVDVAAHIAGRVQSVFGDRLPRHGVFEIMADRGWFGLKSGKGFYIHKGRRRKVNREAETALRKAAGRSAAVAGLPRAALAQQARERMVLIMCKEAFLCLQEGVADTAETLDLAMVLGSGWAPHRGGPITYARQRGVDTVRETLKSLARQYGARFEPVDLLYFPPSKQ
jgi:3-hydroxyacyl-CoA dehydrogenase/enoyl-CoA hydratase/3-hydroxybutyryl-CoA epimerase